MADKPAQAAVDNYRFALHQIQHLRPESDHHGQAERTRHDGRMGSHPATGESHSLDLGTKLGDIGGTEAGRDQHPGRSLVGAAGSDGGRPPAEAADVVSAFGKHRVGQRCQLGRGRLRGLADGRRCGQASFQDELPNCCFQARVVSHQGAGFHDLRFGGPSLLAQVAGNSLQLSGSSRQRLLGTVKL